MTNQCPRPNSSGDQPMITADDIMDLAEPPDHLIPVPYNGGTIYVTADYAKDANDMYLPMDADEAEDWVKARNLILPTGPQVTAIWQAADIKLRPLPLNPENTREPDFYSGGPNGMTSGKWYKVHSDLIMNQLRNTDTRGKLIAGHKKDVIRGRRPGRVKIFGWHQSDGRPIQPESNVHKAGYKDYSHGVRGVFPMWKDRHGKWKRLV